MMSIDFFLCQCFNIVDGVVGGGGDEVFSLVGNGGGCFRQAEVVRFEVLLIALHEGQSF
jgi:hypothetical protein